MLNIIATCANQAQNLGFQIGGRELKLNCHHSMACSMASEFHICGRLLPSSTLIQSSERQMQRLPRHSIVGFNRTMKEQRFNDSALHDDGVLDLV